jgi:RNA polymerase sigma factor (sigma-70 family)
MKAGTEELVRMAREGDKEALEQLVLRIQDKIYGLALKMLGHPEDAEDAAQEILIKIITNIGGFRQESSFETWMYRISSNHLLTTRKRRAEKIGFPLESIESLDGDAVSEIMTVYRLNPENKLMVEEARMRCVQAMLLGLNRKERLAFILGEVFQVTGEEGARILDITPVTFRKRLSRGRDRMGKFMKRCGLINPNAPCDCAKVALDGARAGWLKPGRFLFAGKKCNPPDKRKFKASLDRWDEMKKMAELFRKYPEYKAPESFIALIRNVLELNERGKYD